VVAVLRDLVKQYGGTPGPEVEVKPTVPPNESGNPD
jgi:hypothetical protein